MTRDAPVLRTDPVRRLLDAATEAFAERGFHATTTRDIASRAGMSPAALYVHFRSKEEVLYQIALRGHQDARQIVADAPAGLRTHGERLSAIVRDFACWHAGEHTMGRVVQYELDALEPDHRAEVILLREQIEDDVLGEISAGITSGEFGTPDAKGAALVLLSLCVDVARWYRPDGRLSPAQIGDLYATTALQVVAAR
ncbi:TetR/AcrR family transcriptional regulator [Cryptosporangium aurantiacum]|uniref:Transcriptional regulator, TetR family n=1 Tax=Cryptosporangium aurantiacum TaxID=134849 RepID=A0A1M7QBD8_9ACTN|nr:TetR/AcrR family transcriptional regulator [Cryptosporangium aurantiacum]SHN27869.1 transcriptional regulator, TetR family [Cryptosporangium aurantiacum]